MRCEQLIYHRFKDEIIHWSLMIAMLLLMVYLSGCDSQAKETSSINRIPVKVADVTSTEMTFPIYTSGQLASSTEVKLAFKIGGIVEKIYVDEGASVKKGQLLAALDLAEIQAQVNQAQSAYEKASRDLKRLEKLYQDSVVTLEQKQDATTGLEVAKANLDIAEFNLKHAKIYAPSTGKIMRRMVEKGELVNPGFPAFMFGSAGRGWIVRAGVADKEVVRINLGDSARVVFDVYPDRQFPAAVSELAEALDPMSGTFEVELSLREQGVKMISGFVARIEIYPREKETLTLVPVASIIEGNGNNGFVFAPEGAENTVKKIPVKIGRILDDGVGITSGLQGVKRVVTDGAPYLFDGSAIEIISD